MENQLLEVNLISAQGVKSPFTSNLRRRLQTYAVVWVDSTKKLRTKIDRVGSENPMWNERFIFRVSPSFLSSETSSFTVEIYAVGVLTDTLIGSARILISNFGLFIPNQHHQSVAHSTTEVLSQLPGFGGIPAFSAVQIRRSSGRFHGVLNIAAMIVDGTDLVTFLNGAAAVRYRDLVKGCKLILRYGGEEMSEEVLGGGGGTTESWSESTDLSDGSESTASSSSCSAASILKEVNGRKEIGVDDTATVGEKDGTGTVVVLCGLGLPRKIHISPSDENFRALFTTTDHHKKGR